MGSDGDGAGEKETVEGDYPMISGRVSTGVAGGREGAGGGSGAGGV